MYVGLTEEQQELAATVRKMLEKLADSTAVRAATESDLGFAADLWSKLCEQIGVAALAVPEEYDGAGFTLFETGVVAEALGNALAPVPLLGSVTVTAALLAAGDEALCRELLPRIAMGEVAALAWPGMTGPEDTPVTVSAAAGTLSGTAPRVLHGDAAGVLLVAANGAEGVELWVVDPADATWSVATSMDTTLRFADLVLDAVPGRRVSGDAAVALHRAHLAGTAIVANLQVGAAQRALDMTVAYSKERIQFGRVIGSFQALKHRMADMLVEVETSRSIAWAAGFAVATGSEDAEVLAASAASHCGDALMHVAGEAVQLHGGIGITWEHDISWVFKRAQSLNQLFGLPHQHRALLPL